MARIFEYFVVCGIGTEIRTLDGNRGYHGAGVMYMPALLDQYPPSNHTLYPPPPPQLPTCVLPAGVEFYGSGFDSNDPSTFPRSYPIVLTEGDGSKIYVSCIAFRDPVCEDIAEAYRIPVNSYADKCICLVSRSPSFQILRDALEEIFVLCFSSSGSSKPLWDVIAYTVSNVPLPTPGKDRVLFAIENSLLSVEVPPKEGLPHADISFQPLLQCLDVDNVIQLFTAVLLERRILLRSNMYSLLTLVSEAICHLIYPFRWQHVYIPLLFFSGVDYIDAPTPYMMGLHSGVDTYGLTMDGVVIVDLEHNRITTTEEIPPIPEPEYSILRGEIMKLLHPNVVGIDQMKASRANVSDQYPRGNRPWGEEHDVQIRFAFLKFFASILGGYRNFIENTATQVFNSQAFLKKRSRSTNKPPDSMISQFLDSQGFLDYLERGLGSEENNNNLLDKLQDAIGRGQNPLSVLPSLMAEPEIITISDPGVGISGSGAKYCYDRFPANVRSEEQEEKRKQILAAASGALEYSGRHTTSSLSALAGNDSKAESLSPRERAAERERMVLDIKVKLQGLWVRLVNLGQTDDPLSSFEYGTILALIESDAEGIGGSGFVECIREHIHSGLNCQLSEEQFIAVKELLKTTITLATSRNDMATVRDALEVSAEMYKKDINNVSDYVQRHLRSLSIWEELRFWEGYFDCLLDRYSSKSTNYATLVTTQLIVVATHMAGLGLHDTDAWYMIETIAGKNNIGYKHIIKLRGYLSHVRHMFVGYWGIHSVKLQSASTLGLTSPREQDVSDNAQQPAEASGIGRSWVQSMFSRDTSIRAKDLGKKAAAMNLGKFIVTIEQSHLNSDIISMFKDLGKDDQDCVRLFAFKSFVDFGMQLEPPVPELVPMIVKFAQDKYWRVRCMVANRFLELCLTVGPDATRTDVVSAYARLARDNEVEVRTTVARNVTMFCHILSPEVTIQHILPCVKALSSDSSRFVRTALSIDIVGLAPILEKDATIDHLLPTLQTLLTDSFSQVRLNIMNKLDQMKQVIGIDMLSHTLLSVIIELTSVKHSYGIRHAMIEYIPIMASELGVGLYNDILRDLCIQWLKDKVCVIREAAVQNLKRLAEIFGREWASEHIIPQVLNEVNDKYALYRKSILDALLNLAPVMGSRITCSQILPVIVAASKDRVPNVRFHVAKALKSLAFLVDRSAMVKSILPCLNELKEDEDPDVEYFAKEALQAIKGKNKISPS